MADRSAVSAVPKAASAAPSLPASVLGWWQDRTGVEQAAVVVGGVLMASGLAHGGVLIVTGDSWEGPLSYRKAASFGLSFGLTLLTVAWATSFVPLPRLVRNGLLGVFTSACFVETTLVTLQVWRGVPSHFNLETSFDNAMAMTLAAGGAVIVLCVLAFTIAALRVSSSPSMRLALGYGFVILLAAMVVGAVMIAQGVSLARDGQFGRAYATGGSLKPLHGVTMHAVLVVPGVAWLVTRSSWTERTRVKIVAGTAGIYTAVIAAVAVAIAQ